MAEHDNDDLTAQAVSNLVTQFSSALDFYRELVQNSIDAGSSAVEIWLDFTPDESGTGGVIEIHVDDFGEGMNEEVIDNQLTTLFASSKEGDLTKIGKFGIGFVSVFAPQPEGVLIHTGRGGEYWEVFFHADRSFVKQPLATPVEGTQVTLFLTGDRTRYTELVAESLKTLDHWCRHSEAEITFEDRASLDGERLTINRPFSVEGECPVRVEHEGTEIVLAYSHEPSWGFFNKGLALALVRGKSDLVPERFGHIAFRIKSRYLEHTLSRETVMRDANYDKAMALLRNAADGPLRSALIAAVVELVQRVGQTRQRWTAAERARYFELMDLLVRELTAQSSAAAARLGASVSELVVTGPDAFDPLADAPVWLSLDGRPLTLNQLRRHAAADGRVYVDDQLSPLTERLLAQGTPVVLIPGTHEPVARSRSPEPDAAKPPAERSATLDPVSRLIVQGLASSFANLSTVRVAAPLARTVERLFGRLLGRANPWSRALELVTRPAQVLIGVTPLVGAAPEIRLVAAAERVLEQGIGGRIGLLARTFRTLTRKPEIGFSKLVAAELHGALGESPGLALPLVVVAHEVAPVMARPTRELMASDQSVRPQGAVNCKHPHFRMLLELAESELELAAYCLAKSLLLDDDRGLSFDGDLIEAALDLGGPAHSHP